MKCESCGSDNPDDRFYCSMCGGSLRPAEIAKDANRPDPKLPWDIYSGPFTMIMSGVAVAIVGLMIYGIGLTYNFWQGVDAWFRWPGLFWITGFSMLFLGIFLNESVEMPSSIRSAAGFLIVGAVSSFFVCMAIGLTPTSMFVVGPPDDSEIVYYYDNQPVMTMLLVPLCLLPILTVLSVRSGRSWAFFLGLAAPILCLALVALVLSGYTEDWVAIPMAAVFLTSLLLMCFPSSRRYFKADGQNASAST